MTERKATEREMTATVLDGEAQRALLERARDNRDSAALEALLIDFRPAALAAVTRTLAASGLGAEHAEDALQIAAVRFITRGLAAYRGGATPRTYFTRIAVNAAIDAARLLARARCLDAQLGGQLGDDELLARAVVAAPDAEQRLAHAELARALEACVDALAPHYRESIGLYYYDEHGDCASCAAASGVSRTAFMQRLSRARALLADCLRRRLTPRRPLDHDSGHDGSGHDDEAERA